MQLHLKLGVVGALTAIGIAAGCGSDAKNVEQPVLVSPDGTVVPLEEGKTEVQVDGPDGEKEIKVEVDD